MSDVCLSVRRQAGEAADTLLVLGLQTRLLQTYRSYRGAIVYQLTGIKIGRKIILPPTKRRGSVFGGLDYVHVHMYVCITKVV